MNRWRNAAISDVVTDVKTWNPTRSQPDRIFSYIDLSAIDQDRKAVVGVRQVFCGEAPSRARQLVKKDDVLVSTVRPNLNGVARIPVFLDGATASTGFCVLRPSVTVVEPNYLFHWVKSSTFINDMVKKATGASYPAVSDRIVLDSRIPLPPLSEQRRIAEVLDKAEELRAKRRVVIDRLSLLSSSLFREMFDSPAENKNGFPPIVLGDVILKASDGPHVSPCYTDKGIPFLSARHVRPGEVIWNDLKYITETDAIQHWKKCKPEQGDVLYTKGGTTGIAAAIEFDMPIAIWVHVALLKVDKTRVVPKWLESMLNSRFCYTQSQILTHGIANRDLGLKRMVQIKMFLPPLPLQEEFVRCVRCIENVKLIQRASLAELDALFASLQHRAFRGEL